MVVFHILVVIRFLLSFPQEEEENCWALCKDMNSAQQFDSLLKSNKIVKLEKFLIIINPTAGEITKWWSKLFMYCQPFVTVLWFFSSWSLELWITNYKLSLIYVCICTHKWFFRMHPMHTMELFSELVFYFKSSICGCFSPKSKHFH